MISQTQKSSISSEISSILLLSLTFVFVFSIILSKSCTESEYSSFKRLYSDFNDFRITELKKLGYTNAVVFLHGFGGTLNEGEIYCGYQNKKDKKEDKEE